MKNHPLTKHHNYTRKKTLTHRFWSIAAFACCLVLIFVGSIIFLHIWIYKETAYVRRMVYDLTSDKYSSTNNHTLLGDTSYYNENKNVNGIYLLPFLTFINESARFLYPNKDPDCLYILENMAMTSATSSKNTSTTARVQLKQSMNGYWKHNAGFGRHKLSSNLDLLTDVVDYINNHHQDPLQQKWAQFEQAIYQDGGFPFVVNWDDSFSAQYCQVKYNKKSFNSSYSTVTAPTVYNNNEHNVLAFLPIRRVHYFSIDHPKYKNPFLQEKAGGTEFVWRQRSKIL